MFLVPVCACVCACVRVACLFNVCDCSMQLAVNVQIPRSLSGPEGQAVYIGERAVEWEPDGLLRECMGARTSQYCRNAALRLAHCIALQHGVLLSRDLVTTAPTPTS